MKYFKLLTITTLLALMVLVVPAHALNLGLGGGVEFKSGDSSQDKDDNDDINDDDQDEVRGDMMMKKEIESHDMMEGRGMFANDIKSWIVDMGIAGQVTAVATGSITVKNNSGEYSVTTTDAVIRRGQDKTNATIVVGDNVYVIGPKNGMSIAASVIIVGKSQNDVKPTYDERRQAYLGTITAKADSSITILGNNNTSYTVLTANTEIFINKDKKSSVSDLAIGDKVLVQGYLSGNTISAKRIMTIHLPEGMIMGKITAVDGTTITVLGPDNKTYTVLAEDADIKAKQDRNAEVDDLKVGSNVVVKGDVNGTSVSATKVTDENLKIGFFHRMGLFFKGVFRGKK